MPTNHYDVIVLGDDLAGLVAASLCARRGLRVLVADTPATPPEKVTIAGVTVPRVPFAFVGESSPAVKRVLTELSLVQTLKRRLEPLRPSFQIVLPDARLEVGPDNEAFARELDRELPAQRAAVEGVMARAAEVSRVLDPVLGQDVSFPPDGFWERREIGRNDTRLPGPEDDLLPGLPAGDPARALVSLPAALTLPWHPSALTPTAIARAFDLWRRGSARLEGGRDLMRQLLLDKLRTQHAGEVRTIEPASVTTRWGKVTGLVLHDPNAQAEALGTQHVICAQPFAAFGDLFGDKRPKRIAEGASSMRIAGYRYVLHLVLDGGGVPEGMSAITFVVADPAAPLTGDNAFAVHLGPAGEDDRVVVTITANADAPGDGQILDDVLSRLRARLLARLDDLMPFVGEHILFTYSPNQARPPEGPAIGDPPPRLAVCAPEPLYTSAFPASLGVGGAPYDLGMKGLTAASTQNLPGLGLEGEMAAGWCAARAVCHAAGKRKDYLKDEVLVSG